MSFIDDVRADAVAHVLAPDGRIYRIRRVRTADLAEVGVALLVGAEDAAAALAEIQAEQAAEVEAHKLAHMPPEEQAKHAEKKAARDAHNERMAQRSIVRMLGRNPDMYRGMLESLDAWVCAGVTGGIALSDRASGEPGFCDVPVVTVNGAERPAEASPVRFCLKESAEDLAGGVLWVGNLAQDVRAFLGRTIEGFSGSSRVRPFRGPTGDLAGA